MTAVHQIWLVAAREFWQRTRSKGFLISTFIIMVFVGVVIALPGIARETTRHYRLGLVGAQDEALAEMFGQVDAETGGRVTVDTRWFEDRGAAERALRGGGVHALLLDGRELLFYRNEDPDLRLLANLTVFALRLPGELETLGLTAEQAAPLLDEQVLTVSTLERPGGGDDGRRWMALAGGWLLLMAIATYGQWVLLGVIEEKTNRVVELLLATLPPHHLIAGKVLGIGLVGLLQLSLVLALVAVELPLSGSYQIPEGAFAIVGSVVLWFVLGFAFYAVAFAVAGALVGRQEDAQYGSLPVIMVLVAAYSIAAAVSVTGQGDMQSVRIASFFPPLAPMLMPTRAALGDLALWEVLPAVALMLLATYGLLRLGGRIYGGGQLQSGPRMRLREAWRLARG